MCNNLLLRFVAVYFSPPEHQESTVHYINIITNWYLGSRRPINSFLSAYGKQDAQCKKENATRIIRHREYKRIGEEGGERRREGGGGNYYSFMYVVKE
jgi:hypothetical protein